MVFQIVSGPADYAFNGKNENQGLPFFFFKDTQNRNKLVDIQTGAPNDNFRKTI